MLSLNIANYLASKGLGTLANNIFVDFLPDTANAIDVAVYSTGGINSNIFYEDRLTLQIYVRGKSTQNVFNKATAIYNELQGLTSINLNGMQIVSIRGLQPAPTNIGKDESERMRFTQNYVVKIHNPTKYI